MALVISQTKEVALYKVTSFVSFYELLKNLLAFLILYKDKILQ